MNDEHDNHPGGEADRLPTVVFHVWIRAGRRSILDFEQGDAKRQRQAMQSPRLSRPPETCLDAA